MRISTLDDITFVAAGGYFSYFITEKGNIYCCGLNNNGQLGMGHYLDLVIPVLNPYLKAKF